MPSREKKPLSSSPFGERRIVPSVSTPSTSMATNFSRRMRASSDGFAFDLRAACRGFCAPSCGACTASSSFT
jgi:hypothetical protein